MCPMRLIWSWKCACLISYGQHWLSWSILTSPSFYVDLHIVHTQNSLNGSPNGVPFVDNQHIHRSPFVAWGLVVPFHGVVVWFSTSQTLRTVGGVVARSYSKFRRERQGTQRQELWRKRQDDMICSRGLLTRYDYILHSMPTGCIIYTCCMIKT